jgi:hypothetical protein
MDEVSGLAASRRNPGVLFAHNDSGDSARFFAIAKDGRHLATFRLRGADAHDWEDMAIGPAQGRQGDYVYLADIGNNFGFRSTLTVYRVPEPRVPSTDASTGQTPSEVTLTDVERFDFRYGDDTHHDAETFLVDPVSGNFYIVTKERKGPSIVFEIPGTTPPGSVVTAQEVGRLVFGSSREARLASGGDVSPSGDAVAIRTYEHIWLFDRPAGTTLTQALQGPRCSLPLAREPQGESFAFCIDGCAYVTVSEGSRVPMHLGQRKPPIPPIPPTSASPTPSPTASPAPSTNMSATAKPGAAPTATASPPRSP